MKRIVAMLFVLTFTTIFAGAQNEFTAPSAGNATGGSFVWTNMTGQRLGLSAANLTGPAQALTGGECRISMKMKGQTNIIARSSVVTNSLNFLDGAGALPLEILGEVMFSWPSTNQIQWSVVPKN